MAMGDPAKSSYGTFPAIRAHTCTVLPADRPTQVNAPRLDPCQATWYSIYLSDENRLFKVISIFTPRFQID